MGSSIPGALTALYDLHVAALEPFTPHVSVYKFQNQSESNDYAAVAFTGEPGDEAVSEDRSLADMRAGMFEDFDVSNVIRVNRGGDARDITVARAYAIFDAVEAALIADRKLGGAVMEAYVTSCALAVAVGTKGTTALLRYTVHVKAQRR